MPTLSAFYGIVIQMFWQDHPPPHFHALYAEHEALIDIRTLEVIEPMPAEAVAKDDRAAAVTPAIQPTAPWRVRDVAALPGDRLFVRFVDGLTGIVDLSALIASPEAGVFARLRDRSLFEQVTVEMGAVVWPGELDLAPDAMHAAIKQHGEWKIQP